MSAPLTAQAAQSAAWSDSISVRSPPPPHPATVTGGNSTDIFKAGNVGGLVGLQDAGGTINTSFATGNVSAGSNSSAGGLVGFNNGTINFSGAGGAVSSLNNVAGGLVGFNWIGATITGSFATGNVTAAASTPAASPV